RRLRGLDGRPPRPQCRGRLHRRPVLSSEGSHRALRAAGRSAAPFKTVTHDRSRPGLPAAFTVDIPTTWSPPQALAVFEMLTDLRDRIWSVYAINIQEEIQQERSPHSRHDICGDCAASECDPPKTTTPNKRTS